MGKIVKGAKVVSEAYVVAVPDVELAPLRQEPDELDDRFAATGEGRDYDDGDDFIEEPTVRVSVPAAPQIDFEQVRADAQALIDAADHRVEYGGIEPRKLTTLDAEEALALE